MIHDFGYRNTHAHPRRDRRGRAWRPARPRRRERSSRSAARRCWRGHSRSAEATCDEVVIAAPRQLELPIPEGSRVDDVPGAAGPLAGVVAAVTSRPHDVAVLLGVDFPLLRPAAVAALRDRLGDHAALLPAPGGVPQPLVAVIASAAAGALAASFERGERSITAALRALSPRLLGDAELAGLDGGLENFFNPEHARRSRRGRAAARRARALGRRAGDAEVAPMTLAIGSVPLDQAFASLQRLEPSTHAFYGYDLDAIEARARRFTRGVRRARSAAGVRDQVELAAGHPRARSRRANSAPTPGRSASSSSRRPPGSFPRAACSTATAGRSRRPSGPREQGVHSVNADHIGELDLLDRAAASAKTTIRVALRVNPGIVTDGHRYVATGGDDAKFGVSPAEALEAWTARSRWPSLRVDGCTSTSDRSCSISRRSSVRSRSRSRSRARRAGRGTPLGFVNLGGGFGVDYSGAGAEFPLERYARHLVDRARGVGLEWVLEPGRWVTAPYGVAGRRGAVGEAAERPALRRARRRDERPDPSGALRRASPHRSGATGHGARSSRRPWSGRCARAATCSPRTSSCRRFRPATWSRSSTAAPTGRSMSSNYNGRGRLAEVVTSGGRLMRARAGETASALLERRRLDPIPLEPRAESSTARR